MKTDKQKLNEIQKLLEWWDDWVKNEESQKKPHKDTVRVKAMAQALRERLK